MPMLAASRQGQTAPQLPASCFFMHSHVPCCSKLRPLPAAARGVARVAWLVRVCTDSSIKTAKSAPAASLDMTASERCCVSLHRVGCAARSVLVRCCGESAAFNAAAVFCTHLAFTRYATHATSDPQRAAYRCCHELGRGRPKGHLGLEVQVRSPPVYQPTQQQYFCGPRHIRCFGYMASLLTSGMAVVLLLPLLLQQLLCPPVAGASLSLLQVQETSPAFRQPPQFSTNSSNHAAVASPRATLTAATCRLVLRGHHAKDAATGAASVTDGETADQGLTSISLSCNTTPPGRAVPVAVNSTWVSTQAAAAWQVRRMLRAATADLLQSSTDSWVAPSELLGCAHGACIKHT
jgi:hypothetical protein